MEVPIEEPLEDKIEDEPRDEETEEGPMYEEPVEIEEFDEELMEEDEQGGQDGAGDPKDGDASCKENGPLAHLLWILVFDDQHNQIVLMNLQVIVL